MQVREAVKTDFEAYNELYKNTVYSFEQKGDKNIFPFTREMLVEDGKMTQEDFDVRISDPGRRIYVLTEDDSSDIIGYAEIYISGREWKIAEFYVKQSLQGKGKGRYFFEGISKYARKGRIKRMVLYCPFFGAIKFWENMGFRMIPNSFFIFKKKCI